MIWESSSESVLPSNAIASENPYAIPLTIVEAMSQTRDIRWLDTREASAMNLITDPVGRP
jgi:hypothetical protein